MGQRGPKPVAVSELNLFANEFYWAFRALAEGRQRRRYDAKRHEELIRNVDSEVQISEANWENVRNQIEDEIRAGRIKESEREQRLKQLEADYLFMGRHARYECIADEAMQTFDVPGEPETLDALLGAESPEAIRELCKDAHTLVRSEVRKGDYRDVMLSNWPISNGSMVPEYLSQYAEQFIAAKNDSRFPRSSRDTSKLKQLWFLARAMAGAVCGIKTRTAVNLLGSLRPEEMLEETHAAKRPRKRREGENHGSRTR
jgi:hypothetical protein